MLMLERLLGLMSDLLLWAACGMTFVMMAHIAVDVVSKVFFGHSLIGTLETVTFIYMVGCVFLPLAMVQRRRAQIVVEVFTHSLPPRVLAAIDGAVAVVGCLFIALLTYEAGYEAWRQTLRLERTVTTHVSVPVWPSRWFLVPALAAVAVYLALQATADLIFAITGQRVATDTRGSVASDDDRLAMAVRNDAV